MRKNLLDEISSRCIVLERDPRLCEEERTCVLGMKWCAFLTLARSPCAALRYRQVSRRCSQKKASLFIVQASFCGITATFLICLFSFKAHQLVPQNPSPSSFPVHIAVLHHCAHSLAFQPAAHPRPYPRPQWPLRRGTCRRAYLSSRRAAEDPPTQG